MQIKKNVLTGLLTTAGVATTLAVASPAHALSPTSQLDLIWFGDATENNIDFYTLGLTPDAPSDPDAGFAIALGQGDIPSGLQFAQVKDLNSFDLTSPISDFVSFGPGVPYNFSLSSISKVVDGNSLTLNLKGLFGDNTPGQGTLTTQLVGTGSGSPRAWSTTLAVAPEIPTPALLPGLIGLGLGVLRKRQGAAVEVANSDS